MYSSLQLEKIKIKYQKIKNKNTYKFKQTENYFLAYFQARVRTCSIHSSAINPYLSRLDIHILFMIHIFRSVALFRYYPLHSRLKTPLMETAVKFIITEFDSKTFKISTR